LWGEREVISVANLTREDAAGFLSVARRAHVHTSTTVYPLDRANQAVQDLREGRVQGAAVLVPAALR
jgi:propanol-preferring alcohol dehydrogenase